MSLAQAVTRPHLDGGRRRRSPRTAYPRRPLPTLMSQHHAVLQLSMRTPR